MLKKFLYSSDSFNIYENLATEEFLIDYVQSLKKENGESVYGLFLWQSDNTIVIGRNQDIYKECDFDVVKQKNIAIARRKTGGGAVYQDKGNLNFTFIATNDIYDKDLNFQIIIKALEKLGIKAELSGRNDIIVGDKKFSGNAFRKTRNVSLHHGTLLVATNIELADRCLTPSKYKLKRHGVESVKSRIVNLSDLINLDIKLLKDLISQTFLENFAKYNDIEIGIDKLKTKIITSQYSDTKWIYEKLENY